MCGCARMSMTARRRYGRGNMDIEISTSDPDSVDPEDIAMTLRAKGYFVLSVSINEGERTWKWS